MTAGPKVSEELRTAVKQVFACFETTWPRKFASIWPDGDSVQLSKRQWLIAFRDAKLTPASLKAGLDAVRQEAWPPDNPGEFLALCKIDPATVGAPDLEAAWKEATGRSPHSEWIPWSHRCVYWAAVRTGQTDLAERGQYMRKIFEREYDRAIEQAESLDEPPLARLPSKTSAQIDEEREEAAEEGMKGIRSMMRGW